MFSSLQYTMSSLNERQRSAVNRHSALPKSNSSRRRCLGTKTAPSTAKVIEATEMVTITTLLPTDSGQQITHETISDELSLEQSFDASFTESKQCAYASAIQRLNLLSPWCNTYPTVCSSSSEIFWKGHPIKEGLLRACHSYTVQWLCERDTSWWTDNFSVSRLMSRRSRGITSSTEDHQLFKDVGAWSQDLKCEKARSVLLSSSKVDTVPSYRVGLIDAKLRALVFADDKPAASVVDSASIHFDRSTKHECIKRAQGKACILQEQVATPPRTDASSSVSDTSSDDSLDSDLTITEEQAEDVLSDRFEVLCLQPDSGSNITSATGSGSNTNTRSTKSQLTFSGLTSGHSRQNDRKRKMANRDNGEQESDEENKKAHMTGTSNSMPLEVLSAQLACPFYIFDRKKYCDGSAEHGKKYKTCATGFKNSKDLRDHLKKKHYGPEHLCSRCHTEFPDSSAKAEHEKSDPRCQPHYEEKYERERYILIGTSRRDDFEHMKKPRNTTHEVHWFDVWHVLFPDRPFPTTPYMPHDDFDITSIRIIDEEVARTFNILRPMCPRLSGDEGSRILRELVYRVQQRRRGEVYVDVHETPSPRQHVQVRSTQSEAVPPDGVVKIRAAPQRVQQQQQQQQRRHNPFISRSPFQQQLQQQSEASSSRHYQHHSPLERSTVQQPFPPHTQIQYHLPQNIGHCNQDMQGPTNPQTSFAAPAYMYDTSEWQDLSHLTTQPQDSQGQILTPQSHGITPQGSSLGDQNNPSDELEDIDYSGYGLNTFGGAWYDSHE